MAKVPEDIQKGMTDLSEKKNVPLKSLLARLKEISETEEQIKIIEKDSFRIRAAWASLYREYAAQTGTHCYLFPLLHSEARTIKTKDGKTMLAGVSALVKPLKQEGDEFVEDGDWQYASGTLWRDAAKSAEELEVGKVYQTQVILSDKDGKTKIDFGKRLGGNSLTVKEVKVKAPSFKDFYNDEIEPTFPLVKLADVDVNESGHQNDLRIIEAWIMGGGIDERDGREYGYYDIMDDSISGELQRLFIDPRDTTLMQGSNAKFGVTISDISKEDEDPRFIKDLKFIIPDEVTSETKSYLRKESDEGRVNLDDEPEDDSDDSDEEEVKEEKEELEEESKDEDLFEI